jgi:hypothetical protein
MRDNIKKIKEVIDNNKNSDVGITDIVNPNTEWVGQVLFEKRYSICQECPELIKLTKQCKKCGCFMKVKSRMKLAKCPLGKWDA